MSQHIELPVRRKNARFVIPDSQDSKSVGPIIGYAQELLLPLTEACIPLVPIVFNILVYVSVALERASDNPSDGLTSDESASICLYTLEWNDGHRSLYSILNETLRTADREHLQPWFKYLKLLLTALVKIQCASQQTIWRGIRKDLSPKFPPGTQVIWWSFSSCTTTLPVLENDLYLGQQGTRTLFSIDAFNARNIRNHSYFANEDEILLLPGTYMKVQSQFNPAPDLHVIHLKQMVPDNMLLEPPFEGIFES
ncbi:unnamed protein product [Rotaria sp. Silwood2]|nr:unnamed protein product [Rotaria sp. Silwood2]CAF2835538.1 unnamed protein product [Rotaria sp. Silwood2]CAF3274806.1 unnamed protein product [Rotaria sp. Silwood2]CAF3905167.1 unnamed protein product [Rotaria sp. Silwood2]CAF4104643.1 unnamed protein product [Rotaria sp. Silwood2]